MLDRLRLLAELSTGALVILPRIAGKRVGEFRGMTAEAHPPMRITIKEVGREEARDRFRFRVPRRQVNHHPLEIAVGHTLEDLDQDFGVSIEPVAGIGSLDELPEGKRNLALRPANPFNRLRARTPIGWNSSGLQQRRGVCQIDL